MLALVLAVGEGRGQASYEEDIIQTAAGDLTITFIGHGTLMFGFDGKVIHVDPVGREADYSAMPKADLILVTHEHGDHLDNEAIEAIRQSSTVVICSRSCEDRLDGAIVMENGDTREAAGMLVEAVPAYNLVHMRDSGQPYHPKGNGNGYVVTFADTRVYIAGDTENHPEMKALRDIDVAFLPMNLPYTMTPEMVADAAKAFRPKVLYPYHFGSTNTEELLALMEGVDGVEIRIRDMR
ncbi:MAG: metal-dependent hydrolase [Gemmatimonas sp. SG8_38_2]|nr:MAG: metal-dependent hydrolase [Gemmatimonas sp. SG8_38_2]